MLKPLVKKFAKRSEDGYLLPQFEAWRRGLAKESRNPDGVRQTHSQAWRLRFAVNFYTLRNTAATALEDSGCPENIAQQILGPSKGSLSYNLYSQGVRVKILVEALAKVTYGSIDPLVIRHIKSL